MMKNCSNGRKEDMRAAAAEFLRHPVFVVVVLKRNGRSPAGTVCFEVLTSCKYYSK